MSEKLNLSVATKAGVTLPSGVVVQRISIPAGKAVTLTANDPDSGFIGVTSFAYPVDGRFEHEVGFKALVAAATISATTGLATNLYGRPTRIRGWLNRVATNDKTAVFDVTVPPAADTLVFDYRGGINRYEVEGTEYAFVLEHNGSKAVAIDQWFYKRTFKATT